MNQNPLLDPAIHLSDRCLVRVGGDDAMDFLQNVITNDMRRAAPGKLLYACLLMPQGFYLHDFFIGHDNDGYFLDCETARVDDLLRRFTIFKLRAKVTFARAIGNIYSAGQGLDDPRLSALGKRFYTNEMLAAVKPVSDYHDLCIEQGVPCGSLAMKPERDTMADVNLELLNAVAWDKGCFIGQEVAARMYNRSSAKRRLYIAGRETPFTAGEKLGDAGEVRQISSTGKKAIVQLKVTALAAIGGEIIIRSPEYLSP